MCMKQNFTTDQLISYLYKETSVAESMAICQALEEDWNLWEAYQELLQAKQQLPKVSFLPSSQTIQNILGYSEQSAVPTH